MTRTLSLAAILAAGLALPAIAGDMAATTATGNRVSMEEARQHLMRQGYTSVSALVKDANGKWVGSAIKDGRTIAVAVDLKPTSTN